MLAVALQREPGGVDRLDRRRSRCARCTGSAPARPPGRRSARGCARSRSRRRSRPAPGVPPSTAHRPAAAIEQAEPTSPWHPTSAPEIDAFSLNRIPIAAAVSRNSTTPSSSAPVDEPRVEVQHGRDDAGGPVGRGGDDPPAGRVLLVDGEGVEVDPLHGPERVAHRLRPPRARPPPGLEGARAAREPRRTLSPPGSVRSSRVQPLSTHSCMTPQRCSSRLRTSASGRQAQLVGHHDLGDRQPGLATALRAARRPCGTGVPPGCRPRRPGPRRSPARRRRSLHPPSSTSSGPERPPDLVERLEGHPVGMSRQRAPPAVQ